MNERYSLTFPQQNIWLENRLYGNSNVNLITGIININKEFNTQYCKKAINNIIKNNDAMRIRICINDSKPYQKDARRRPFVVTVAINLDAFT